MSAKLHAVLIADVMRSSNRTDIRKRLGKALELASERHLQRKLIRLPYSITAGDEFQTVAADLSSVPSVILDLRTQLRPLSLRIGVGFGPITDRIQAPVNRLSGPAFQAARLAIESVKEHRLFKFDVATIFNSSNSKFDRTLNLIYGLQDTLVLRITTKQWKSIEKAILNPELSREQAARSMSLAISTVSRNLKRGYYWQLLETVKEAESLIKENFQ